jgi:hypothetical protein
MKNFIFIIMALILSLSATDCKAQVRQSDGSIVGANATIKATIIMEGGEYTHRHKTRQMSVYFRPSDATLVMANSQQLTFSSPQVSQHGAKTRYIFKNVGDNISKELEVWTESDGNIYYVNYREYEREVLMEHLQVYNSR